MNRKLTNEQIDEICKTILNRAINQNSLFIRHIELLYRYGLRSGEVVQSSGIHRTEQGALLFNMPKTKHVRTIQPDDFTRNFDLNNFLLYNQLQHINKRNLQREVERFSPYRRLFCGNKPIITHLFRHNYAKRHHDRLNDVRQVNALLQEQNESVCANYINSSIRY